ncbi:MAG: hypothetical protein HY718_06500 [Planctomycetes bacterium]|nr:hypothetical protein [Planctomycetota bacterium]
MPVKLYMPPRIEVKPSNVLVSASSAIQQASVSIVNSGETAINILEIKKSRPEIQTQFYPEPDGRSYKLQVTLPAGFRTPMEGDRITIRTDDEDYQEIVIPVRTNPAAPRPLGMAPARPR